MCVQLLFCVDCSKQPVQEMIACSRQILLEQKQQQNLVLRSLDLEHSLQRDSDRFANGLPNSDSSASGVVSVRRLSLMRISRDTRGFAARWTDWHLISSSASCFKKNRRRSLFPVYAWNMIWACTPAMFSIEKKRVSGHRRLFRVTL